MRADARRNLDRIVAAARALFAERGFDAPMEDVARRAGVGAGTLYRRFPDRWALIRAVSVDGLRRLADIAGAALAEEPDAWDALRRFLERGAEERIGALHTLDEATHDAVRADPEVTAARRELIDALGRIVRGAQSEGRVRRDVGAGDIVLLLVLLTRPVPGLEGPRAQVLPARYLRLVLDGLGATSAPPLPGDAVSSTDPPT